MPEKGQSRRGDRSVDVAVRNVERSPVDLAEESLNSPVFVGTVAVDHLEEDDTNAPDVGGLVVEISLESLGGHVDRRPDHRLRQVLRVQQGLAETEVCDFEEIVGDQDVRWLQVSVQNVVLFETLVARYDLGDYLEGMLFLELATFHAIEVLFQVAVGTVLVH